MKLKLKGCPRCKGTLVLDKDRYGFYEQCLQCGHLRDITTTVEIAQDINTYRDAVTTGNPHR